MKSSASDYDAWRVAKKIKPSQGGAIKLARIHGRDLLCVRYRESPDGTERLTAMELVVERSVIQKHEDPVVSFKVKREEFELRERVQAKGAKYDYKTHMWRLPRSEVIRMGLRNRIAVTFDQLYQEQNRP
ncbi:MAG: hypothetical protein IH627_04255 [Rubrivivax sp.]|nr:hypothetical protein [Rubrivivax sp.]